MATYTPVNHTVFNELDNIGLLLDLTRLAGERNDAYKQRLLDVFVHRGGSNRLGLVYAITRELGLDMFQAMTITPVLDTDGNTLGDNPAIIFEETKCYVYSDYTDSSSGLAVTIDRYDYDDGAYNYSELLTSIQATGYFAVSIKSGVSGSTRSMTIYDQSSVETITSEDLSTSGAVINLNNNKLFSDSVSVTSTNLTSRVSTQVELIRAGQYYIDYLNGIIYTAESPSSGSAIRYKYRNDNFKVWASPVIIHNLQSADFKTKMFEQITDSDGDIVNGAPKELGADFVNELLSVIGSAVGP